MKISLIADTHGKFDVSQIPEDTELILLLGDNSGGWIFDLPKNIPVYSILGNHDTEDIYLWYPWIVKLNGIVDVNGIKILGVDYCVDESHTQEYFQEKLKDVPKADIVISHAPPTGLFPEYDELNDCHQGIKALEEYIMQNQPKYCFCGHIHEEREKMFGKTKVCCVYTYTEATI